MYYSRIQHKLPKEAVVEAHIASPLDQTSDYAYGGADMRGIFIGNCRGYLLTQVNVQNIYAVKGICHVVEIAQSQNGHIHVLNTSAISGLLSDIVHVHNNCDVLHLRDIHNDSKNTQNYRTLLENIQKKVDQIDDTTSSSEQYDAFVELSLIHI